MPIQFSLVDDDEGLRQLLPLSLRSCSDLPCVGCYASGAETLAGVPRIPGDMLLLMALALALKKISIQPLINVPHLVPSTLN